MSAPDVRIGIVASKWYPDLMDSLLSAALNQLRGCDVPEDAVDIASVPGSFELPMGAKAMVETGRYDAVVCLGVVIRGETTHYDYVAGEAARGIVELSLSSGVPVLFGVLTCENREQAVARSGGAKGNKGGDTARAAVEMAMLLRRIREPEGDVDSARRS